MRTQALYSVLDLMCHSFPKVRKVTAERLYVRLTLDDIADVAVAALTRPELHNRLFEVTGPREMTSAQCVAELSKAVGYPVEFTQITMEDFSQALRAQGMPDEMLWLMNELFTVVFDGRNSQPASGVEEALGRPATDFSAYLQKVLDSGAWERSGLLNQKPGV